MDLILGMGGLFESFKLDFFWVFYKLTNKTDKVCCRIGNKKITISNLLRQFLHAKTLGFVHPKNNQQMIFSSNLPHELNNILKMLRNTNK